MTKELTYYVKRNGVFIWLAQKTLPMESDEIVEVRTLLLADEGMTLLKDNEDVGQCYWLQDEKCVFTETPIIEEEEVNEDERCDNSSID